MNNQRNTNSLTYKTHFKKEVRAFVFIMNMNTVISLICRAPCGVGLNTES